MLGQSFRMAFGAIVANKMRSFLTMLGIIIGIMAVVVLVSIVNSATSSVTDQLSTLGADKLTVMVVSQRGQPLTLGEVNALMEDGGNIAYVAPTASMNATMKAGDTNVSATAMGSTPSYMDAEQLELALGRSIKTPDVDNGSAVAVLGPGLAKDLFGRADVVGETFSINGRTFQVVGVLEDAGSSLLGSPNDYALIPYTVAQRMAGTKGVSTFTVVAAGNDTVAAAEADVQDLLMGKYNDEDAFTILNQSTMLESLDSIMNTMTLMLGGIASISLLVGGIGIMNIMLVSVAERTKEIGIRKAIGASRSRILLQFLIESLVLSTVGGLIGLGVSWVALEVLSAALGSAYAMTGSVALLAVFFSMAIGVVFGLNPANKAAKMTPIVALRTE